MTPRKIMAMYKAINELAANVLPYSAARQIRILQKNIAEEFETILQGEKNLVRQFGGITDNGTYKFESADTAQKFHEAYESFLSEEVEVAWPKINLVGISATLRISAFTLEALEDVIIFGEE